MKTDMKERQTQPQQEQEPAVEPKGAAVVYQHPEVVISKGAEEACAQAKVDPALYLCRHWEHDWGEVDEQDRQSNQWALEHGGPLGSCFRLPTGVRLWVVTDEGRSVTRILLPEEY
jgi:hypothetical protein